MQKVSITTAPRVAITAWWMESPERATANARSVRSAGRSLTWSKGFVKLPDNKLSSLLRDTRPASDAFEYFLPPGDYVLLAYAGSDDMRETVHLFRCHPVVYTSYNFLRYSDGFYP